MQGRDPGGPPERHQHSRDRTDFQGTECRYLYAALNSGDPAFIAEEEGTKGKASASQERRQGPAATQEKEKDSVKYQISEQPSALVREEDFARQLRIARHLAAGSLPPSRSLEPATEARAPKDARALTKARTRTKKETPRQKAGEAELAKERSRARQKTPSSRPQRGERQRPPAR